MKIGLCFCVPASHTLTGFETGTVRFLLAFSVSDAARGPAMSGPLALHKCPRYTGQYKPDSNWNLQLERSDIQI